MPDIHRLEMGPVGVGVADTIYQGHFALVPEGLNGAGMWCKAKVELGLPFLETIPKMCAL